MALIALAGGVLLTIQMPASQAIVSTVVDRAVLGGAIALNSAQYNLMRIVGPSLAGLAIAAGGLAFGFVANAVALVVVAVIFIRLPLPPTRAVGRLQAALWGDLRDGVRHVAGDPILSTLVLLAAAPALFILSYLTFLPVYARDILAIGAPGARPAHRLDRRRGPRRCPADGDPATVGRQRPAPADGARLDVRSRSRPSPCRGPCR